MRNIFDVLAEWGEKYYESNREYIQKRLAVYDVPSDRENKS